MVTPIFCCGAECKLLGSTATPSHWNLNVTNPVVDTTTFNPGGGAASYHWTGSGSAGASIFHTIAQTSFACRGYVRVHAYPSVTMIVSQSSNVNGAFQLKLNSTGGLLIRIAGSAADVSTGITLSLDTWYLLDWASDASTGTTTGKVRVNSGSDTTDSHVQTSANFTSAGFGANVGATAGTAPDIYWDDFVIAAYADYPIGPGFIDGFVPVQDGSHNTGAAGNFTDAAGTNITNATTTAWTFLDELPPSSTDRVEQRLDTTGNLYVEVRLNPTGNPYGVEALVCYRGATATSCSGSIKLRDNLGATDDNVFSGAITSASDLFTSKHYATRPAALGNWTPAAFADLRFRVGFGTDVTPDVWIGGVMIEAAFGASLIVPHRHRSLIVR